jgi:hypothetical protein
MVLFSRATTADDENKIAGFMRITAAAATNNKHL